MNILLLGAGFSRNWHGWLATELVGELLGRLKGQPSIARLLRENLSFEETLGLLQQKAETSGVRIEMETMQSALTAVFKDMNRSFAQKKSLEFSADRNRLIAGFLANFDAIFTLNQDLLLELHYPQYPNSWCIPGVRKPTNWDHLDGDEKISTTWNVDENSLLPANTQPLFKLHGSVNWRDDKDRNLIVMGVSKANTIQKFPLLRGYFEEFRNRLNAGNSKLMVIGYGFRDDHINEVLKEASKQSGLAMHLVDPAGLYLFEQPPDQLVGRSRQFPEFNWIGVSTRQFRDAFVGDEVLYASLMRFFAPQ